MSARAPECCLLLITGAPASGKSVLAGALAQRLRAVTCSKDEIKETLLTVLGSGDAAWSRALSDASFALLFQWAPRLLGAQSLVLMEGNFRPAEHAAPVRAILERSGARLVQILCLADPAARARRLAQRAHDPQRHPGHRDRELRVAAETDGFLELPGPRLRYDSTPEDPAAYQRLCAELEPYLPPRAV